MALTNVPAEVIGSQILIFHSGGAQIRRYISNVVLAKKSYKAFGFFTLNFSLLTFHSSLKHVLRLHMALTPSQLRWR